MKPIRQIVPHKPDKGQIGDCFRACIASLLELPAEEVPHFCDGPEPSKDHAWYRRANAWLKQRGMIYMVYDYSEHSRRHLVENVGGGVYHILEGKSFSGDDHCVVGKDGEVVFDPCPFGRGLNGTPEYIGFLVATNHGTSTQTQAEDK